MRKHAARVDSFAPSGGNIKVLFITDKQWEKGIHIMGRDYRLKKKIRDVQQPSLFEFW